MCSDVLEMQSSDLILFICFTKLFVKNIVETFAQATTVQLLFIVIERRTVMFITCCFVYVLEFSLDV